MFPSSLRKILLLLLFADLWYPLLAQNVTTGAPPAWVDIQQTSITVPANAGNIANGIYYLLTDQQWDLKTQTCYRHYSRKILSSEGVQNASQIAINFNPEFQQLVLHEIKIIRGDKIINALHLKKMKLVNIESDMNRFIFNGTKTAIFIPEDLRKGDIVDFSYSIKGSNPIFKNHFENFLTMQFTEPVGKLFYRIVVPAGRKLNFRYFNNAEAPEMKQVNGNKEYTWQLNNIPAKFPDDDLPSWYQYDKEVQVSEFETWNDVKNWAVQLFNVNTASPQSDKIARAINAKQLAPEEKMLETIRFVQDEIRYMGIEIGTHSHRPHSPGETIRKRFGDCKDKALLLCTLLKKTGFDAAPVLIAADLKNHLKDFSPCSNVFDHVVVCARLNNKNYWIDATLSNQGGTLQSNYFPDYRAGLLVDSSSSDNIVSIEPHDCGSQVLNEYFEIKDTSSSIHFRVLTHYTKRQADHIRSYFAGRSLDEISNQYLNYYAKNYPEVKSLRQVEFYDNRLLDTALTVEDYEIKNQWARNDSEAKQSKCEFFAQGIFDRLTTSTTKIRTMPVGVNYPMSFEQNIFISMNDEWKIADEKFSISNQALHFDYDASYNNRKLKLTYRLNSLSDYISAEQSASYTKDLNRISNSLGYALTMGGGATELKKDAGINLMMVLISFLLLLIFSYMSYKIYHRNNFIPYADDKENSIGGFLFLLGMGLCITPLRILYRLFSSNYFDHGTWLALTNPENAAYNSYFAPTFIFEVCGNLALFVLSVFCIFLFFKRRNIFPLCGIIFFGLNLFVILVDQWLVLMIADNEQTDISLITRTIIISGIWIPYLLFSDRVKSTFILPSNPLMKRENIFAYKNEIVNKND